VRFEYFEVRPTIYYIDIPGNTAQSYLSVADLEIGLADAKASPDAFDLTWKLVGIYNDGEGRHLPFEIGDYEVQSQAEEVMRAIIATMKAARDLINSPVDVKGVISGPKLAADLLTSTIERSKVVAS